MVRFKPRLITIALAAVGCFSASYSTFIMASEHNDSTQRKIQDKTHQKQESKKSEQDEKKKNVEEVKVEDATIEDEKLKETDNRLTITGSYSASLIRSIDEKRHADTVSEHISSDDLGALPDVSIADALTRLPGISAVRTGGQAAEINIRGLSGGFILATLNGREQVSTSGSRSVEFDQYPSELIAAGSVFKSQKASLIEGGVAGTVELKTASPLLNKETHRFNANVRTMVNDRASEVYDAESRGDRISFSYQGKFFDETLGLSLGFARLNQPSVATQFIGLHYGDTVDVDGLAEDNDGPDDFPDREYISEGMEMQHKGGVERRDGYVAAMEWSPSSDFLLRADAFLSKFNSEQFARGLRVKFGGPTAHFYNPQVSNNNVVGASVVRTGQSWTRVEVVNDDDSEVDDIKNYGVNFEWNANEQLVFKVDLSHSSASSDFQNRLLWSLVAEDASASNPIFDTNVAINYQLNGLNLPNVSFNQNFNDINQVMVSKYGTYPYQFTDRLNAFKFDGEYSVDQSDWLRSIQFGYRFSVRKYDKKRSVFEYGNDSTFSASEAPFQLTNDMVHVVNWSGNFNHFPSYLAIDIDQVLAAWLPQGMGQPVQTWGLNTNGSLGRYAWTMIESGDVSEDVESGYLQANIDTQLGEKTVTGNVGIRVIHTDQQASTLQFVNSDPALGAQNIVDEVGLINDQFAPEIDGTSYTDYLPQLNLNFQLTDDSQLRFSAAKVMSRPPIQQLAGELSGEVSVQTEQQDLDQDGIPETDVVVYAEFNGRSVNSPKLKPFYANQYDLSYEYFFDNSEGALIAALFYKDIKSFIDRFQIEGYEFADNGFFVPEYAQGYAPGDVDSFGNPVNPVLVTNGTYSTAVNNAKGGYIRGAELAYTQVFSSLPEVWAGLGVSASYSYTDSEVSKLTDFGGTSVDLPLEGLSRHVFNGSVFYSFSGFETRLNMRYRSKFVPEQIAVNEQKVFFDAESVFDYQASYEFDNQTKVLFQINNVTDQPTKSYFGSQNQTGTVQFFGRQYFLGVSFSI